MDPVKRSSGDLSQRAFWDAESATAQFSHPVDEGWLMRAVKSDGAILDYGCGYGRTLAWLRERGFSSLTGLDPSEGMLARATEVLPRSRLVLSDSLPTSVGDASIDLVLLLAVLTSIPDDESQEAVMSDIYRILRPGGHLILSDLPLQTDARRVKRYAESRPDGLPYGAFSLEGGRAVMRHHPEERLLHLLADFEIVQTRRISVPTMRGRPADVIQYLVRKD